MSETSAKLRIDKWLWYARVAKTRSMAAKLVTSGHVRLNKEKVTAASQTVKIDDVLTVTRANAVIIYRVVQLGSRRGPASEAQVLYEDLSPAPSKQTAEEKAQQSDPGHRPSKRDRREILRVKRGYLDE
ncbi:heat shock protein Hsp15 [Cohaesibacter sp. ES.047]|uniref:RNA-binding S4 domain-containing protein n=1 Tax=Cohaesibacter sp. ES.047 TaxID=1798205 RepID=UPI000BB8EC94|nr:RNA-binding S4 domain-containing protein [Cohaesibacter sp. ES.047]SNY90870.1 heat shock protein Hsp15 [Cohaesibacter sp. ES.047]